jgi:hypothetical protein
MHAWVGAVLYEAANIISDQATQGLHGVEELGDEARQAERDEESQSGAGPQTRRHHASVLADGMSFRVSIELEVADDDANHDCSVRAADVKPRASARRRAASGL